jgi:Protein of unknown function (DUF2630)
MNDSDILQRIHALVAEEKELRAAHAGDGLRQEDRTRLANLEEQLDQAWDLLRQRRAREETGGDPEDAKPRSVSEVEGYLQ